MTKRWTTKNIPDLTGKVIIVTGANAGLGFQDARILAKKGATVILACRNMLKAKKALGRIKRKIPATAAEIMELDLASLESVKKFAETFKAKYDRLDVLINNAGIMMVPYRKTIDGFESQIGINHLGHFALTARLFDLLKKTKDSRVVNVSSTGHKRGYMDFDNFLFENGKDYSRGGAYGRSKLANILFAFELDRRLKKANIEAKALAAHPGASNTKLGDHLFGGKIFGKILRTILRLPFIFMLQSPARGALPTIRAAVDPNAKGGEYYGPKGLFGGEFRGRPEKATVSARAHNLEDAKKLWEISEKLTRIKFDVK